MRGDDVKNWIYFAGEDLKSGEILMKEGLFNKVCFLSQQCIEKSLKAFMITKIGDFKKTHKTIELLAGCSVEDKEFENFEEDCLKIDRYYLPTRYPDAIIGSLPEGLPSKENARDALDIAHKIFTFVKDRL